MNQSAFQSALAVVNGKITLAHGTLTPDIDALIASVYGGGPIVIDGASIAPGTPAGTIAIQGTASFLNAANLPVEASFVLDTGGSVHASLRYTLLGAQPPAGAWRFSNSFPNLPPVVDWSRPFEDPLSVPLDDLGLFNSAYVVVSHAQKDKVFNVDLQPGLNFVSNLHPNGIVDAIENVFGGSTALTLYGPIVLGDGDAKLAALTPFQYPWSVPGVPGIYLQASLGLSKSFGKLNLQGILFRLYTPASADWLALHPTFTPALAYTGTLAVPSADLSLELTAMIAVGATDLLLVGNFAGFTLANLASLVDFGPDNLISLMPDQIRSMGDALGKLELTHATLGIGRDATSNRYVVSSTSITVGMPDLKWQVWQDHFEIDSILCSFAVDMPFDSAQRKVAVHLAGVFTVEGVAIDVSADSSDSFTVYAQLSDSLTIPLSSLMSTYVPSVPPPSNLTIDALAVSVAPRKSYAMSMAMAGEPNPWTLPLGPTTLTVSDVSLNFVYPQGGPLSGAFAGTIALGSAATMSMVYNIPGPLVLDAKIPRIGLTDLAREIAGSASLPFPDGFPQLDLVDSEVKLTAQKTNGVATYDFLVRTTVAIGNVSGFNLAGLLGKNGSSTGFAAAIWTPKWASGAGWSPGSLWQPLSVLEIDSAGLIVSTLAPADAQKGQLIPLADVPALAQPVFKVVPGVTFFATLSLNAGPVTVLREIFGDKTTFNLFASFDKTTRSTTLIAHLDIGSKAAFSFQSIDLSWNDTATTSAEITLAAGGSLSIDSESLAFKVAGSVSTDASARLALNVSNWVHPFGYDRLTVSDFGIAIALGPAGAALSLQGTFQFTTRKNKAFLFGIAGAILDFEAPSALAFDLLVTSPGQELTLGEVIEGVTTIDVYDLPPGTTLIPWIAEIKLLDLFLTIQELGFWAVVVDQVEICGVVYKKGFGFRGAISLFGIKVQLYVELRVAEKMFAGSAEFPDEVRLGSVLLLSQPTTVTVQSMAALAAPAGAPAAAPKGPAIALSSTIDATHRYYLYVAAHVELFDIIKADILGQATNDGIAFLFDLTAGTSGQGAWASQQITVLVSREHLAFSAGLAYDFGLKDVTLGGFDLFGTIPIPAVHLPDFRIGVSGTIGAALSPPKFALGGSLTFEFMGLHLDPSFNLDLDLGSAPQKLGDFGSLLLAWIKEQLADLLKAFFDVMQKFVDWVKQNFDTFKQYAEQIATVLKNQFNQVSAEVVKGIMSGIGWAEDVASEAVDTAFKICAMAQALTSL